MKIAIMQPYLFPYIGYFQMIHAVDKFVFYDDVNFIKQGWINRNQLLVNGKSFMFTVPLQKATSFNYIKDTKINEVFYGNWKKKILTTINQSYKKAPYFKEVFELINEVLGRNYNSISEIAICSCIEISNYLNIDTEFIISSKSYNNTDLDRTSRIYDICSKENADNYINAIGGQELYDKSSFYKEGIQLNFIKSLPVEYRQFSNDFVSGLSIIDVLMFNEVTKINEMLNKYYLL